MTNPPNPTSTASVSLPATPDPVELRRRIDDTIATIRALDTKASILLAVLALAATATAAADPGRRYGAMLAYGLGLVAAYIVMSLLPRRGTWLAAASPAHLTTDDILDAVAEHARPDEQAAELRSLLVIADRKVGMLRMSLVGLFAVALVVAVVGLAHT